MNRRERKKEETHRNIIECGIGLFREKGFKETSMEEIAEKADVSKGTLYNYFQDKESILSGYFQIIISGYDIEIKESVKGSNDIKTRLYNLLDFINHIFGDDTELAAIYFRHRMQKLYDYSSLDDSQRSGMDNKVLEIIKEAQMSSELRSDIPAVTIARNFQFLAVSFFISSIFTNEPIEMDMVKNQLVELFLNGAKL